MCVCVDVCVVVCVCCAFGIVQLVLCVGVYACVYVCVLDLQEVRRANTHRHDAAPTTSARICKTCSTRARTVRTQHTQPLLGSKRFQARIHVQT